MEIRFTQDVGDYKAGDEISLESAVAQAYINAGVAEAMPASEEEGETPKSNESVDVEKAINNLGNKIEQSITKALNTRINPAPKMPAMARDNSHGIKSLGEMIKCLGYAHRGDTGAMQKMRLFQKSPTGHNETTAADGGYLVPQEWSANLYEKMTNELFLMDFCDKTPTKRLVYNFPILNDTSRATGSRPLRYYAIGEGNNFTASKAVVGNVQTSLTKFGVLTYITSEELTDNAYNLETKLGNWATKELRFAFNDQIINGDGNSPNQTGILNAAALVTVSKEGSQTAGTINLKNLKKMFARLHVGSQQKAVWLFNQYALSELIDLAIDPSADSKASAYGLTYDVRDDVSQWRLFGRPVYACEQCAALGLVGDVLLVDFSAFGVAYHDISVAVSDQLNFINDEIIYRWSVRFATKPLWSAAMTPYKGNQTTSPFVALESRGTA